MKNINTHTRCNTRSNVGEKRKTPGFVAKRLSLVVACCGFFHADADGGHTNHDEACMSIGKAALVRGAPWRPISTARFLDAAGDGCQRDRRTLAGHHTHGG